MNKIEWFKSFRQLLKRPAFLLVALVLFAGAVGLNGATAALRLHFRKDAMPLRSSEGLSALPKTLGPWVWVPEPHSIDPDMVHNLGTDKYVFREYIDTSARPRTLPGKIPSDKPVVTPADVKALGDLAPRERMKRVDGYRGQIPAGVISVAITYYTGKVDTVPHVPDRCYVADGFQPSVYKTPTLKNLGTYPDGRKRELTARFIDFEDQTSRSQMNRCVMYFFHANGHYEDNPDMVRARLQDLRERCAYFAKIEVMMVLGAQDKNLNEVQDAMERFLAEALPEIEKLLPDWETRRR